VLRLLSHGEHALLQAVEKRRVPLSVAIEIATSTIWVCRKRFTTPTNKICCAAKSC
jgi:hypothetical protein